jgi:hypothetical protein
MKIFLKKNSNGSVVPADMRSGQYVKRWKTGDVRACNIKRARNYKHHKKFFALVNLTLENQERYKTIQDLLVEIKLKCGWYDEHITTKGKIIYVPRSIAFENMEQDEFNEFYESALDVCAGLLGTERGIIENEMEDF